MILKINGVETDYERIHRLVEENTPDSLAEGLLKKFHDTEWYQHTSDFNVFENYDGVKALCDENLLCWMDAVNRSGMEISEPTKMVYRFISHRAEVIKDGFANNFWPDYIDWNVLLDCIAWFI